MTDADILGAARTAVRLGVRVGVEFVDGTVRDLQVGDQKSKVRRLLVVADDGAHMVLAESPSPDLLQSVFGLPGISTPWMGERRSALREVIAREMQKNMRAQIDRAAEEFADSRRMGTPTPGGTVDRAKLQVAAHDSMRKFFPGAVVGVDFAEPEDKTSRTLTAKVTVMQPAPDITITVDTDADD